MSLITVLSLPISGLKQLLGAGPLGLGERGFGHLPAGASPGRGPRACPLGRGLGHRAAVLQRPAAGPAPSEAIMSAVKISPSPLEADELQYVGLL